MSEVFFFDVFSVLFLLLSAVAYVGVVLASFGMKRWIDGCWCGSLLVLT